MRFCEERQSLLKKKEAKAKAKKISKKPAKIIIAAAVAGELANLLDRVEMPTVSIMGGRKIITGYLEGKYIGLLVTGPGLVNAVQALSAALENFGLSLIILTGYAGAFKETGMQIGDIGIATEEIDVHLGLEPENENLPLKDLPFPTIKLSNKDFKNRYPLNCEISNLAVKTIRKAFAATNIGIYKGPFVTVSTITATESRANYLYEQFKPCMENMEGSGVAHLAIHYAIPLLEIRCASNLVGKRNRDTWNLPVASERIAMAVIAFIHSCRNYE